jgi:glycyl-tRNA synthetase beta chain
MAPHLFYEVGGNVSLPEGKQRLLDFFKERIDFYLRESRGQAYDVVKAVLAAGCDDIRDLVARAEAVTIARGGDDFKAVSAAFKRMKNILAQAGRPIPIGSAPYAVTQITDAESALYNRFVAVHTKAQMFAASRQYLEALETIATLRPEVDAFFESVLVNDPDTDIRENRLRLLEMIVYSFSNIADFSEIVTAG